VVYSIGDKMLNGLDLFSGIGGISFALKAYLKPVAYCEIDKYAQAVLVSRMSEGQLFQAPIWDDIKTLSGCNLPSGIDILYGGFPCQDISVAGNGAGLAGERSGLFFEILRLDKEIKPSFIFLENVAAIRTRGLDRVVGELADLGYDARWCSLSASEVGANHKRDRWFLLAYRNPIGKAMAYAERKRLEGFRPIAREPEIRQSRSSSSPADIPNIDSLRMEGARAEQQATGIDQCFTSHWWDVEPNVLRVAHGVSFRVERIKSLGNSVVPHQVKTAFERLMGLSG
jgi:DNA (cytosine-5)-methyltransferase 1